MKISRKLYVLSLSLIISAPLYSQPITFQSEYNDGYFPSRITRPYPYITSTTQRIKPQTELELIAAIEKDSTDFKAYIALAQRYRNRRKFDKSEDLLKQSLHLGNDTALVYQELGTLYNFQQKTHEARGWYEKALELSPNNPNYLISLAGSWMQEDKEKAIEYYEKALAQPDCPINIYYSLAQVYQLSGQKEEINSLVQKLLAVKPFTAQEANITAYLYQTMGDKSKAIEMYEKVIELDTVTWNQAQPALTNLANLRTEEETLKYLKKLLTTYPNSNLANFAWWSIIPKFQSNTIKDMDSLLEILVLVNKTSQDEEDKRMRRTIFIQQNPNQQSNLLDAVEKRNKNNAGDEESLWLLGMLYSRMGRNEESIPYFQKLVKKYPDGIIALSSLASVYEKMKRFDDAITIREKILTLPINKEQESYAYMNLANDYTDKGDSAKANEIIEQIKKKYPDYPNAYNALGMIYKKLNQPGNAIRYMKLYADSTNNIYIKTQVAQYYIQLGRTDDAEKEYLKILQDSKEGDAPWNMTQELFNIYARKNQVEKILDVYDNMSSRLAEIGYSTNFRYQIMNPIQNFSRVSKLTELLEKRYQNKTIDKELTYLLADCYSQQGGYNEKTIRMYENIISEDSSDINAMNYLINAYSQQTEWEKVKQLSKTMVERNPENWYQYNSLINSYKKLNQSEEAEKLISQLKEKSKTNIQLLQVLAGYYQSNQQYQNAIALYEQMTQKDSTNIWYKEQLGDLYNQTSDYAHAIQIYETILKNITMQDDYRKNQIRQKLIKLYFQTHNEKKGMELYETNLSGIQNEWQIRDTYQQIARELMAQGKFEETWNLLDKIIQAQAEKNPKLTKWQVAGKYFPQGYYYPFTDSQYRYGVQSMLEKKRQEKFKNPLIYILLTEIYRNSNWQDYQTKGAELWKEAIILYPNEPEPLFRLAEIYMGLQKPKDAIFLLEKVISIKEKREDTDIGEAYNRLSLAYIHSGQMDKAETLIEKLVSGPYGKDYTGLYTIGNLYEQSKQYEKAIAVFKKMLSMQDNDVNLKISMIRCYVALKQYDAVETTVNQMASMNTQPWQIQQAYQELVKVYDSQGLYEKEIDTYIKMLEINPQNYRYNGLAQQLIQNYQNNAEKIEKLIAVLEKRLEKNPKDWISQGIRAELYFFIGKTPQ